MYRRRKQRNSIVQFGFGTCLERMQCKTLDRCRCMSQQHTGHKPTARQILGTSRESMACMQSDRSAKTFLQGKGCSSTARCKADRCRQRMAYMKIGHCYCCKSQQNIWNTTILD
jgi:hypothetical protein